MKQGSTGAVRQGRLRTNGSRVRRRALRHRGGMALVMTLGLVAATAATTSAGANAAPTARAGSDSHMFRQVNLVSDIPGMAALTDPDVKNPWGIAFGPKKTPTPLWVNNQFNPASAVPGIPAPADLLTNITLYAGANGVNPISKVGLEVQASSPTGIVFNPTSDFMINQAGTDTPARFLFNETFVNDAGDNSEGCVTGWSNVPAPAPTTTRTDACVEGAFPTGLALIPRHNGVGAHLLVVDGFTGDPVVHEYDTHFADVTMPGRFVDPNVADEGMVPYNAMFLKGKVYVTYFTGPGQGGGAISVFNRRGMFLKRLVTGDPLNAPWGMAISPKGWNGFGRALIVGNVDNGMINAFGLKTGRFRGTLKDAHGDPFVNLGLWGIAFGNGLVGTPRSLLFAAGVGNEPGSFDGIYEHGLVGLIEPLNRHDEVS
jgi:uncharacterized protein (TIGR03118 family)